MKLYENIYKLTEYGIRAKLIDESDRIYTINRLLEIYGEESFQVDALVCSMIQNCELNLAEILDELVQAALERGLLANDGITQRDLFDTKLMGCLVDRPGSIIAKFRDLYRTSPKQATDFFYEFSQNTNYIRRDRIKKDMKWKYESPYGEIDITINLSKPEKDPKAIAAAKQSADVRYPACQLCVENEGYAGRIDHPARQNHRIIPLTMNETQWGFQYSPYVYYNEHCIVFNGEHTPMKIDRSTFVKLFDFVKQFPHYFLGSNADLPIVGGSILSHDHFQGGCYSFAMEKAPMEKRFTIAGYDDVEAGIVKWPLSVIRIRCKDEARLIDLADHILSKWREYTDESAFVFAYTDGEPHNTITPIARKKGEMYELDLALRNNITTEEHPLGVYHPHKEYHHIKKENIGLIEVMGLAVLPARLKTELKLLADMICWEHMAADSKEEGMHEQDILAAIAANEEIAKHTEWIGEVLRRHPEISRDQVEQILHDEIGNVFVHVLEDAGVFKCTKEGREAFDRFVSIL